MYTMSEESCCKIEIDALKSQINNLVVKSEELKQEYKRLLIQNLEKDVKIRNLKKELEINRFSTFKGKLSEICLSNLEIIGNSISEDSTFVSCVMNDLFSISELKKLTLSGHSKVCDKVEIPLEKKEILQAIFSKRLENVPRQEVNEIRRSNLNKLIRNAIDNVNKKKDTVRNASK